MKEIKWQLDNTRFTYVRLRSAINAHLYLNLLYGEIIPHIFSLQIDSLGSDWAKRSFSPSVAILLFQQFFVQIMNLLSENTAGYQLMIRWLQPIHNCELTIHNCIC
ncbi:hypothetical protein DU80_14505 [Methanosarcina mazei]|uniref:Uncharacterized protein n=1 Tax=Methanosarcina mazei TaxID=2209 RepID=A0A0F8UGQ2_METMZ|nr:hypothetical protein DU80_14505 [Methanosarcina mazei]